MFRRSLKFLINITPLDEFIITMIAALSGFTVGGLSFSILQLLFSCCTPTCLKIYILTSTFLGYRAGYKGYNVSKEVCLQNKINSIEVQSISNKQLLIFLVASSFTVGGIYAIDRMIKNQRHKKDKEKEDLE